MMKEKKRGVHPGIAVVLVPLLFFLCCGGDDTSTGPSGSTAFTSDNPSPGSNSVVLEQRSAGVDRLTLSVRMVEVQNVYGAAFEISYPQNLVRFSNFSQGGFLSGDGAPVSIQVAENPVGNLIIGATRLGNVGGISGTGDLLLLNFNAVAPGSGRMNFRNASLRDPANNVIPGVQFIGGNVQVSF